MVRSFTERDCDWRKKQKWREGDQEVDRQEGLALQEEAILGLEIAHQPETLERHHHLQTDQDPLNVAIQDHQEDRAIQDHQEEQIQDHQEEQIQDLQSGQEILDLLDDPKVPMLKDPALKIW